MLSCNNLESAEKLAQAMPNRPIISSDSPLKIYSDGTLEGGNWKTITTDNQGNISKQNFDNTPYKPKGNTDKSKFVRMGEDVTSIDDLKTIFGDIIGEKGLKHIFRGEVNTIGAARGVHHISAIRAGTARIIGSIEPMADGFYKATVEVLDNNGNWILKTSDKSTFFPDAWSETKVMEEIQSARNNMIGNFTENTGSYQKYFGLSNSGHRIYIVRTPLYSNNIFTAWFEPL